MKVFGFLVVTTLLVFTLINGKGLERSHLELVLQSDSKEAVEDSETIQLAGNTACNPRAQVCEE